MLKGVFIDVKKLFCCDKRKFKCFFGGLLCFCCIVSCLLLGVLFVVIWVCNK